MFPSLAVLGYTLIEMTAITWPVKFPVGLWMVNFVITSVFAQYVYIYIYI